MEKTTFCNKCDICISNKNNPVWGYGNEKADIVFVGEAPGATERRLNMPFVGVSGRAFRAVLNLYGFDNSNTYLTTVLKCRPPANREPTVTEIINCVPYLGTELNTINPKIVVLVGSIALKTYYNDFTLSISKSHGLINRYNDRIVIPIYNPSYLIRNPDKLHEFETAMNRILWLYRILNPLHTTNL
jgi:DNA polymerase